MAERKRRKRGGHRGNSFGELTNIYNPDDDMEENDEDIIRPIPIRLEIPAKKPKLTANKLEVFEGDSDSDNDSENDEREPTQFNEEKEEKYDRTEPFQMIEPGDMARSIRDELKKLVKRASDIRSMMKDLHETYEEHSTRRHEIMGSVLVPKIRAGPSNTMFAHTQNEMDHLSYKSSKERIKIYKYSQEMKELVTKAHDLMYDLYRMTPPNARTHYSEFISDMNNVRDHQLSIRGYDLNDEELEENNLYFQYIMRAVEDWLTTIQ
jgi:hypothetical protein